METSARFIDSLPVNAFARVELEIGSARGELLCDLAAWHPYHFYIGVDIDCVNCERATALKHERKLNNIVFTNREGLEFLSKDIPSEFLDTLHIYHPTPWDSTPARRLINLAFEKEAFRTLRFGGDLRLLTDDYDYFSNAVRLFDSRRWWETSWQRNEFALRRDALAGSPVEMKSRAEGLSLYHIQLVRLASF